MVFLDINLTKYNGLLLLAQCFYWQIFQENQAIIWFYKKNTYKGIRETRKLEAIYGYHFVERKNECRKPDKNSSLRGLKFMLRNID